MTHFLRAVFSVGSFTVLSRVTGYFRDFLIIHLVGIGMTSDALAIVIKLPSFFRRLFAEGAFHVSFLPRFTESQRDPKFAGMVLSLLILAVGLCIAVIELNFTGFASVFFGKLSQRPETLELTIRLGRITLPYVFFISLASFFTSVLNAYGRFSLGASSQAIGNIFVLIFVLTLRYISKDYGAIFAWAILLSGAVQMMVVMAGCFRSGYRVSLQWPRWTPQIKGFLKNFLPGMLSVGVIQLNLLVGIYLASGLPEGGISYLMYADRLNQLPLSVIGVSLSSVLLPLFSHQLERKGVHSANKTQNHTLRFVALIVCPVTMFVITLSLPLVALLFGHGKLTDIQLCEVAKTLTAYTTGLPAYILIKVFSARFFAHNQTRISLMASVVGVATDVVASLAWVGPYQHIGIAYALSVSAWVQAGFLAFMLYHRYQWRPSLSVGTFVGKVVFSCGIGGLFLWVGQAYLPSFLHIGFLKQAWLLLGMAGISFLILWVCFKKMKVVSRRHWALIKRSFTRKEIVNVP
jgi:putative peptidoglycan lipid II flippase